jgi:hypothetical protein
MPPDDKIKREIEDILNKLDDFVPEESTTERVRRTSSNAASSVVKGLLAPFAKISIQQLMLTALIIIVVGFFAMRVYPAGRYMLVGGVILFLTAFALSFFNRSGGTPQPSTEKRWRGQPIDLREPTLAERIRDWIKGRNRRPRY